MTNNPEVSPATLECKYCGEMIRPDNTHLNAHVHQDGKYACYGAKPVAKVTYAEPK